MPPFGFARKEEPQSFTTDIADEEDLGESTCRVSINLGYRFIKLTYKPFTMIFIR